MGYLIEAIGYIFILFLDIYLFYIAAKGLREKKFHFLTPFGYLSFQGDSAIYPSLTLFFIAAIFPLSVVSIVIDRITGLQTVATLIIIGEAITLLSMIYYRFRQFRKDHPPIKNT